MTIQEELQLVDEAKQELRAFEKLYDYYVDKIYSYSMQRVLNKQKAEDITSAVFLKAVENIHKFDTGRGIRFGAWLYRIAHNEIIDGFRKNKEINVELDLEMIPTKSNVQEEFENKSKVEDVMATIAKLKPKYQQILTLKFFEEMSVEEISEVMGIKKSNVSVILHRATKSFMKKHSKDHGESSVLSALVILMTIAIIL